MHHPTKRQLFAYAESLAAGGVSIPADTARHLAGCEGCASEVRGMRDSLEFVGSAPELEPSPELTGQILAAARSERIGMDTRRSGVRVLGLCAKGLACAATLLVMAGLSFRVALHESAPSTASLAGPPVVHRTVASRPSPEDIRKATADLEVLAGALYARSEEPLTPAAWQHRRAVNMLNADMSAALAFLKHNPGSVRASRVVNSCLKRQVDTMKMAYVEQTS